jgi:Phosphoglycerate kinase
MLSLRTLARQTRLSHRLFHATAAAEAKLTVEQLAEKVDLKGKNVLVRVDLNVPLAKVRRHNDTTSSQQPRPAGLSTESTAR